MSSSEFNALEDLPDEIKRMVFKHLSVEDLLNMCLTSKRLNEFIGQSHEYMQKIWIKFYTFKLKDLESLTMSTRNYEKLKVNRVRSIEHFEFMGDLQQPWRKVLIYNCEFKSIKIYINLIESFCESIEELEVSDIEILNNDCEIGPMKFPNLRRIMFRNVPSTAIEVFLGTNKKLTNAAFDIAQEVDGKIPLDTITKNFLFNSEKLQHLQLGPHYIKSFFDRDEFDLNFQFELLKLLLKFPIIRDESPNIEINIANFLSHQAGIEWIVFFEISSDLVFNAAWNQIPSLQHVTVFGLQDLFDDEMDLTIEPNENITHLDIISRKILISQLRKLLAGAPCLKVLQVQILTKYVMEFTARNHQIIQELRYENIEEDVPVVYDELKASSEDVNKSIKLRRFSFWRDTTNPFSIDPTFWHT